MSKEKGGYAFPTPGCDYMEVCGMTLRDYFAAKAMPHVLDLWPATAKANLSFAATKAYEIADAMLAERNK